MYARQVTEKQGRVIPMHPHTYTQLDNAVLDRDDLDHYEVAVYLAVARQDYAGNGGRVPMTQPDLMTRARIKARRGRDALLSLQAKGLVAVESGGGHKVIFTRGDGTAPLSKLAPPAEKVRAKSAARAKFTKTKSAARAETFGSTCQVSPDASLLSLTTQTTDTTPDGVGAFAPPAAQDHEPRAHNAPTEESLPPARTAAAEPVTEQQEPESAPGLVFEEETAPPALPPPPKARRQSTPAAAPVADTPTLVQARALLATLGVEVTPVTLKAMDGVVEKWAERCEKACGMTLEEKALDVRCWLDGPKGKKQPPTVQRFRNWVQGDTEKAEKAPPLQVVTRQNGNGAPRAAPSPVTDLTAAERKDLEFFAARRARQAAARKAAYDAELAGAEPGGGEA